MARFVALDRLRALAVLSMVQGHTFSALLARDALPPAFMQLHALVHGLTAPAFLFGAGLAFGVASYPSLLVDRPRRARSDHGRRFRRYAGLLLLGYALQLPGASLTQALRLSGEQLAPLLRVGPLQLVALCLTCCQLLLLAGRGRAHALASGVLGIAIAASSPLVYSSGWSARAPAWAAAWLDDRSGSLFPIFPWSCFVFLGVAAAWPLVHTRSRAALWLRPGIALTSLSYALFHGGVRLSEPAYFWKASPLNMAFRLGLVLCCLGALHPPARDRDHEGPELSIAALLARHSLVAYVCHLLLLYGTPFTPSLVRHYGRSLDALEATVVFVLVMLLTTLATYGWSRLHKAPYLSTPRARVALAVCSLLLFVR